MTFLVMMDKNGKVLRHLLSDDMNISLDKNLVYTMLSRYIELGFMWVDYVVVTYRK